MVEWPQWWSWELEFSPHLLKRMIDRSFNEADLRLMLENATGYHENHEEGRWAIASKHDGPWEIIVEPVPEEQILVIVTVYPID
jgi:hypothetical protein